jgi:hypothetical protein
VSAGEGGGLRVDDQHLLGKTRAERQHLALRVERHAVAVENQFVVRADHVDLHQRHRSSRATRCSMASRVASLPRCQGEAEIFTISVAPASISSRTGIAPVAALGPEIGVVPDVLANGQRDFLAAISSGATFSAGSK